MILGMLIIAMSVIVISNVFRMSANERISEFGTLKCVGATGEQICKTILYECLFLCILAVPAGVALGYLFSFLGIGAANGYMDELNVLVRSMMKHVTFSLSFVFSPLALFVSVAISAGTVIFSALLPARKAMKVSALECIRNSGGSGEAVYGRTKAKLCGKRRIEYELARKNTASYHKKMKSAVTAFSFSIILFVTMSGLKEIADGVSDYISMDYGYTVMADYTSNFKFGINEETGRRECHYAQTISHELAEKITGELAAYEENEVFGMGQDYFTYVTFLEETEMTEDLKEVLVYENGEDRTMAEEQSEEKIEKKRQAGREEDRYELEVEIITIDEKHYRELCARAGTVYGEAILVNDYKYNDHGTEKHILSLTEYTSSLKLEKADGSVRDVEIGGMLSGEEVPKEFMYPNVRPVRLILPFEEVRGYNWMTSPQDEEGYMAYAKDILEKYFPQGDLDYGEAGFVCRVFGTQDYSKIMNIAVVIAFFFLYGFVLLLGLIGILNVMSTEMFQIRMRAREFAVLQSIGMTPDELDRMLYLESVFCAGKALVTGLPAGMILVFLMKYCVQKLLPFPFHMPWVTITVVILVSFASMWGTMQVSMYSLRNQNLIETIRM